ncbi:MAG TPA: T9SS type A sorting domain-containing protein [Bacteroidales bacterium]|nr:T9SS type A sorting domain-containing protein [Bacteroidales bacterium]
MNIIFSISIVLIMCVANSAAAQCVQCEGGIASGTNASIIGTNNIASGNSSFAGGKDSEATGRESFAFGKNAKVIGSSPFAIAIGHDVTAFGGSSIVLGRNLMTTTSGAMIIGTGFNDSINSLKNEVPYSLMIGFNSSKPTFFVGESSGSSGTGKIGIGNVTDPQAKLHILGDYNSYNPTEASLLIESAGNHYSTLWLGDKEHSIYTKPGSDFKFSTSLNTDFVFENGNVGIGTNSPEQKLDVNGTIKATGFQLVNNTQGFGKILQSDEFGNATWVDAPSGACVQCDSTTNTGEFSSTLGKKTTASDFASFASGYEVLSSNAFSFAHGKFLTASGANSLAIGSFAIAEKYSSMVIGVGFSNDNRLKNDIRNSLMIGFGSNVPTFFIEGYHGMNRTGRIGIGNVTAPQAKLHIRADENYDTASVFIQAFNDNKPAYLWMGNKNFGIHKYSTTLEFLSGGDYVFGGGNVGIGTNSPEQKLDVNGTIKATGFQLMNNTQGFGKILQSDEFGNATWVDPSSGACVQCDENSNPSGLYASVIGIENTASGEAAFASGKINTSPGDFSTSLGYGNNAEGKFSLAGGEECSATGQRAFAYGQFARAEGSRSLALGKFVLAYGANSVAIGRYVKSVISDAMIIGCGIDTNNYIENNEVSTLMIGFNSNRHTFFVDKASGLNTTGKIGIGNVTDPEAKLHILGDNDPYNTDDASLYIESAGSYYSTIYLGDKSHFIKTKPGKDLEFNAAGQDFYFNNGNAGFGTNQPAAKVQVKDGDIFIEDIDRGIIMKSPDGNCWRGTVNNQGMLEFTQVDCQTLETGINSPEPSNSKRVKIYPNPVGNQVFINCEETLAGLQLEISDINGRLILSQKLRNTENSIDVSTYQPGTYLFRLTDKNGKLVATEKVIKE